MGDASGDKLAATTIHLLWLQMDFTITETADRDKGEHQPHLYRFYHLSNLIIIFLMFSRFPGFGKKINPMFHVFPLTSPQHKMRLIASKWREREINYRQSRLFSCHPLFLLFFHLSTLNTIRKAFGKVCRLGILFKRAKMDVLCSPGWMREEEDRRITNKKRLSDTQN